MSFFWKLLGYKSFVPNIDDYVRIEDSIYNPNDCRKIEHIYDLVQIKQVTKNQVNKIYNYSFTYSKKLNNACHYDYHPVYYTDKWGGMKPLTEEDKLQLL